MLLLWTTKPKNPISKLIRWGLDEEMSHFAMCFFPQYGGVVVEQVIAGGFTVSWLPHYVKKNKVTHCLQPKTLSHEDEVKLFIATMTRFSGTKYDFGSFVYFGWRAFLRKFFKKPLPDVSQWGRKRDTLCTGLAAIVQTLFPDWLSTKVDDFEVVTPGRLLHYMRESNKFIEKPITIVDFYREHYL